jgi:hypothetical protein
MEQYANRILESFTDVGDDKVHGLYIPSATRITPEYGKHKRCNRLSTMIDKSVSGDFKDNYELFHYEWDDKSITIRMVMDDNPERTPNNHNMVATKIMKCQKIYGDVLVYVEKRDNEDKVTYPRINKLFLIQDTFGKMRDAQEEQRTEMFQIVQRYFMGRIWPR